MEKIDDYGLAEVESYYILILNFILILLNKSYNIYLRIQSTEIVGL